MESGTLTEKIYYFEEDEIRNICEWVRKRLKLPKIKINIHQKDYPSDHWASFDVYNGKIEINLINVLKNLLVDLSFKSSLKDEEKILFIIFHEFAHYLQYYRHKNWLLKYFNEPYTTDTYNDRKLEKNANKIAEILFKEYKEKNGHI